VRGRDFYFDIGTRRMQNSD